MLEAFNIKGKLCSSGVLASLIIIALLVFETPDLQIDIKNHSNLYAYLYFFVKGLLPFVILLILGWSGFFNRGAMKRWPVSFKLYFLSFLLFVLYAILPTSEHGYFLEYLKILPRFALAVCIGAYLKNFSSWKLYEPLLWIATAYFLIHIALYVSIEMMFPGLNDWYDRLTGMLFLGRFIPTVHLDGHAFVQFRGVFGEPSNAAAFYGALSFVALGRYSLTGKYCYLYLCSILLLAVVLTFSLAGYWGVTASLLIGLFLVNQWIRKNCKLWYIIFMALFIFLSILRPALLLPQIQSVDSLNSEKISYVAGTHKILDPNKLQKQGMDLSDGRLSLVSNAIESLVRYPLGIGVQNIISKPNLQLGVTDLPSSAPFLWLVLLGIPGFILLLFRESLVSKSIFSNPSAIVVIHFMAYLVYMIQNLSYGTWMTPMFFLLGLTVITSSEALQKITIKPNGI